MDDNKSNIEWTMDNNSLSLTFKKYYIEDTINEIFYSFFHNSKQMAFIIMDNNG
ncbi:hypothetical protein PIROE2DRAFT_16436 [Piromyces sp. E2]|nr:hypothetical protein PIROE2DRAFT_16436 [Piromyces sp. E2]|eukprot:OUM58313.1 hypothetical protein PIROE2DRAFT_16436 [Piromyces sp. E2]